MSICRQISIILILAGSFHLAKAQQVKTFLNPGFEGEPSDATMPVSWFGCEPNTTPDILPGPWGVYEEAEEGDTFLGLITREDGSFESISQRLSSPLEKGDCYTLSFSVAHSMTYSGYNSPIQLRVWAADRKCRKKQFIGTTGVITSDEWSKKSFKFTLKQKSNFLIFEAFFPNEENKSIRGNILLDNIRPLIPCPRA